MSNLIYLIMKKKSTDFLWVTHLVKYWLMIMFIFLFSATTAIASTNADKVVTIKKENISVKDALNLIKKQTGINVMYEDATLNNVPLKLSLEKVSLENALSVICSQAGMRYEMLEKNYVLITPIKRGTKRKTITGVVKDDVGGPVSGASVVIKGTTFGTIADADGRFMLSYPEDSGSELMVSFIGMNTEEVKINNKRIFNIRMKNIATNLDEVFVIGYGTAKAKDLTGSVSRLNNKELKSAPMTAGIQSALQGRAAGVNVMISSASPTSPVSVVVRGLSSLSGDGQPLWVIDGVPQYSNTLSGDVANTLYNLNLNDVESIDILKDASATAVYGSRGANGVIIVSTKSGVAGMKPTIELSSRVGWQSINSNGFKTFTSDEYINYSKLVNIEEAFRAGALTYFNKRYMDAKKFDALNTSQWDRQELAQQFLPTAYYDGHDNYWDMLTQGAVMQDYSISLRGGQKQNSYYASFNYKDQDGIVKGSNSKLFSGRFNFESLIGEKVKLGFNMDASSRTANNKDRMISKLIGIRPDYPAYKPDGSINTIDYYTKNPLIELMDVNKSESKNFNGSLFMEYNILPCLKFRTTGNLSYSNVNYDSFNRTYYSTDINKGSKRQSQNNVIVWENLLTFYKTIGKHDVQAILGQSMERNSNNYFSAAGSGFPDNDVLNNLGSASVKDQIDSDENANSLVSAFARVQYKFNNRYLVTGTFRTDGSSRFGKDSRWGYFPSGALGWILTEEKFMNFSKPYVSYLKLRASYGLTGSQNLGNYDFVSLMGSETYNKLPGIIPSSLGNTMLQWESQQQTDFGLDYGFLNDRIRGSVGWYKKYVDNLIYSKPVPTSSSFSEVSQNVGAISNSGIEFEVRGDIIKNKNITWEMNFNAATNKGKLEKLNGVTKFLGGRSYDFYKVEEGDQLGRFYGFVDAGRLFLNEEEVWGMKPINPSTGKLDMYRNSNEGAGDLYVLDLNGDGKITDDGDRTYLGSANPDFFGGFGSSLYWKGLMVNMTFSYSVGGKRYWAQESTTCNGLNVYNAPNFLNDSWAIAGENAKYPFASHYGYGGNGINTSRWLHDASYVRLSAINLSYQLPATLFKSMLIKGIELNFQATNLFTITPYPGMDPQGNFSGSNMALSGFGTDNSTYPAARTYNMGIKFTFK